MAVFIELTTDPFEEVRNTQQDRQRDSNFTQSARRIVRRPTRGMEVKEDRPAVLKVIRSDGKEIPLVDAGAPNGQARNQNYANFLLQNVQEARMEKHQIVETFGESFIFFFGEAPRFIDVQVTLINSHDFNWKAEWWENYERYFRGTKLAEMGARLYMFYDDNIVEGYMLNSQAVEVSDQPFLVQMNFRMFVTSYRNITFIDSPLFPTRSSAVLPDGVTLTDADSGEKLFSSLRGAALGDARAQAVDDEIALINSREERSTLSQDDFDQRTRLTNFLRAVPRSTGLPLNVVQIIESLGGDPSLLVRAAGKPLRELISANTDEYIGLGENGITPPGPENGTLGLPAALAPTIRSQQEVEDLWLATIAAMRCYGAEVDDPDSLLDIGLMPKFGEDSNDPATFKPIPGVPFGVGLTDPSTTNAQLDRLKKDPLGAVFGGGQDSTINDNSTVQGTGDRAYGYDSAFGSGPGYGKSGYGDYGGSGYGSGQGEDGDPGFRDPSEFSFLGVEGQAASFSRFNKSKPNNTVFGEAGARVGLGASNSGLSGGGSTRIQGSPSAFAIASVGGELRAEAGFSAGVSLSAGLSIGGLGGLNDDCAPVSPPSTVTLSDLADFVGV